ncbi:MAG: YqgE/AlgH family protein [Bacteroidales bacterium]
MKLKTDLFKIHHSDLTPRAGCLLISEPFLNETYFQRSVILMVECENTAGMGLVLNKPGEFILNDLIEGLDEIEKIPVFCGGPVRKDRLFYLHTLGEIIPGSVQIGKNLYIDGDFELILAYLRSGNQIEGRIRFFLGYAGWEYQQLMQEIEEDAWIVAENRLDSVLNHSGNQFWRDTLMTMEKKYHQWLNYPPEPFLN